MKRLMTIVLAVLISATAYAQPPANLSPQQLEMMQRFKDMPADQMQAEIQRIQEKASAVGTCMQDVNQAQMEAVKRRGEALNTRIQKLCQSGNEEAAQRLAMSEGVQFMNDPTIKKLKECSQDLAMPFDFSTTGADGKSKSICSQ